MINLFILLVSWALAFCILSGCWWLAGAITRGKKR